jgi:hypothetical protein
LHDDKRRTGNWRRALLPTIHGLERKEPAGLSVTRSRWPTAYSCCSSFAAADASSSAHAPEMKPEQKQEQAVTPQREIAPKQEQSMDIGLGL